MATQKLTLEQAAMPEAPSIAAPRVRKRLEHKHPLVLRWTHWINFPILFLMIWSGTLILWAHDAYPTENLALRVPNRISFYRGPAPHVKEAEGEAKRGIKLPANLSLFGVGVSAVYAENDDANFPAPAANRHDIGTGFRLSEGMAWHFALAWIFTLNGVAYTIFTIVSGQWKYLLPKKDSFVESFKVVLHDIGLWKHPLPAGKYNHAQRIAYSAVWAMGIGMVITGVAIYKPAQLAWLANLLGGYQAARTEHFLMTCLFVAFFFVHVAQVARTGWNNFRGMITGAEIVKEEGAA